MTTDAVHRLLAGRLGSDRVDWVVICGSGIGAGLVDGGELGMSIEASVALRDLGLPAPAVQGHGHAVVRGRIGGRSVAIQTGRLHPYEGHSVETCTAVLRALLSAGAGGLVLTCAVGALAFDLSAGQIVVLRDQMNLFGPTPLVGPRFISCSTLYGLDLRRRLLAIGRAKDEALREVVYAHARGPQYETPAETEALRRLGGDVVGMSTTYEAILGASFDVPTCGLGIVTNMAADEALSHDEVQARAGAARSRLAGLLRDLLCSPHP